MFMGDRLLFRHKALTDWVFHQHILNSLTIFDFSACWLTAGLLLTATEDQAITNIQ